MLERKRLQALCKTQEKELNDSFTYVHENFGELMLESLTSKIIPKDDPVMEKISSAGNWIESFLPDEFMQNKTFKLVLRITQMLIGKWMFKKFKKIFE